MMKIVPTLIAAGFMLAGVAFQAQAMPAAPVVKDQSSSITLVREGCGHGWHRGPHGHCRRNW